MKKVYFKDRIVRGWVHNIIQQMYADEWRPDYIVGLTRGGLVPANMISQYLDVPMETLKVSLRDSESGPESNLWMAEDAYAGKKILVVDDINDSGATLNWILSDWPSGIFSTDQDWNNIWNHNVRFAVTVNNTASEFSRVDYSGHEINKIDDPQWIVFPWEHWWEL